MGLLARVLITNPYTM